MNTLIAVHKEILDRSLASSSIVRPTKIGTVPIGFKTENKAANKYIKSSMFFLAKLEVYYIKIAFLRLRNSYYVTIVLSIPNKAIQILI
jgi:hypothetical protein